MILKELLALLEDSHLAGGKKSKWSDEPADIFKGTPEKVVDKLKKASKGVVKTALSKVDAHLKGTKLEPADRARLQTVKEMLSEEIALAEGKWSGEVKEKWHPAEGFFTRSAKAIASGLMAASKDEAQAMSRLNFYINRAGKNLSAEDHSRLEHAKALLQAKKK